MQLKVSILSSDDLLLDGQPTDLARLEHALAEAKAVQGMVYYYREMPPADPSPKAMEVLKLVVKYQLPVTLSTKPDFSDYVDAKGVPHPRPDTPGTAALQMPEVKPVPDIEALFAQVRKAAGTEAPKRGVRVLTPERELILIPLLAETPAVKTMAANLDKLVPSAIARNIAGIGYTAAPALARPNDPNQSPAFFALLVGLCQIGHSVWAFEGHASALAAGCRDADALIVDSGVRGYLPPAWTETVTSVMRNANILVFDRTTAKLAVVKRVGSRLDQLEFMQ